MEGIHWPWMLFFFVVMLFYLGLTVYALLQFRLLGDAAPRAKALWAALGIFVPVLGPLAFLMAHSRRAPV
jgi:hypothetical protein